MEQRLYLFEVVIDNIYFDEGVSEIPQKKQIIVSVKLGRIASLEIRSETLPVRGEGGNKRLIDFNAGKSYLAALVQENLLQELNNNLEISVGTRGSLTPIGTSSAPWDDSFKEMVQVSDEEFVTPASISDNFCLMQEGAIKGNVQLFLRLSCFGKSIQTHFEVLIESGQRQFLFKMPNVATTFMCSKYGVGTSNDFIPVGPLYTTGLMKTERNVSIKSASWTAVMEGRSTSMVEKRSSQQSICLFPEYLNIVPPVKDSAITFDIVSLRARPEEEKFIDFLTGKKMEDLEGSIASFVMTDEEGHEKMIYYFDDSAKKDKDETPRKESKACQCPKTPVYCKHVYAAIAKYEKSHPDLMIYGKRVKYEKLLKNRNNPSEGKDTDSLLRLRGGSDEVEPYVHKKKKGCYNPCCRVGFKLRSVGISQVEGNTAGLEEKDNFCADFYCPESTKRNIALQVKFSEEDIPSFTCKNKYCPAAKLFKKLGLGPLATEKCQGTLYGPVKPPVQYGISQTYGTLDTYGPYGIFSKTNTPFMQGEGKTWVKKPVLRLRGGGTMEVINKDPENLKGAGHSKSPIAECQEIMDQFDKILEEYRKAVDTANQKEQVVEEYMEPSTTPNCGHPRCTYISEPALKPIHWDCPEPLPEGICKNPQCPYLPDDLKRIGRILDSKRNKLKRDMNLCSERISAPNFSISRDTTGNNCPFYNPPKIVNMMQICDFSLPNMRKTYSCCSNPNCPLKGIVSSCSNPGCPFAHGDLSRPCSNPDCPFKVAILSAPCSNPDCPLRHTRSSKPSSSKKSNASSPCSNPSCPFKKDSVSMPRSEESCHNPDCPFKQMQVESEESCHNPDCPFKQTSSATNPNRPTKETSSEENCGNPECPFNENPVGLDLCDLGDDCKCDNPDCPAQKETCSNPKCPFNAEKVEICGNPSCPYKSKQTTKKKGVCGPVEKSVCGDHTCPFNEEALDKEKEKKEQSRNATPDSQKLRGVLGEGVLEYTKADRSSKYDMSPCNAATCKIMGGKLECVDCATLTKGKKKALCPKICPGDVKCPMAHTSSATQRKKVAKKEMEKRALKIAKRKFVYHFGDDYPGMHRGHKHCVVDHLIVPAKMGWLWNVHTPCLKLRPRKGWRPGCIGKTILEAIQAHRRSQNMPLLEECKVKKRKKYGVNESETELIHPKPTVQIKRKEGVYYITMNPLKDPNTLVPNENPYMETTPLQFRIMKNKPANDYKTCVCNDDGYVYEPEETSSSDSELDIEFTPPAGLIRPERFVKIKNVIHIDTQYDAHDIDYNDKEKNEKDKENKKGKGTKEKGKGDGKDKKKEKNEEKVEDKKKDKGKGDGKDKKKRK